MSKNPYEILGIDPSCDQAAVDAAYYALRDTYRDQMYQEGALGKAAAKKLNEVEKAYAEISAAKTSSASTASIPAPTVDPIASAGSADYSAIEQYLREGKLREAQDALDASEQRNAAWHYLQSIVYYKKGWLNESRNQLQIACNMDPTNTRYSTALEKMDKKIESGKSTAGFNAETQSGPTDPGMHRSYAQPHDERAAEDGCCRFCQTLICFNCLCDCCCRG